MVYAVYERNPGEEHFYRDQTFSNKKSALRLANAFLREGLNVRVIRVESVIDAPDSVNRRTLNRRNWVNRTVYHQNV